MNTTSGNSYNFFEEEDEEAKNERQEIRENVNNAMRDGNLFREKNSFNEVHKYQVKFMGDKNWLTNIWNLCTFMTFTCYLRIIRLLRIKYSVKQL